jgi:hypothetical protein
MERVLKWLSGPFATRILNLCYSTFNLYIAMRRTYSRKAHTFYLFRRSGPLEKYCYNDAARRIGPQRKQSEFIQEQSRPDVAHSC